MIGVPRDGKRAVAILLRLCAEQHCNAQLQNGETPPSYVKNSCPKKTPYTKHIL